MKRIDVKDCFLKLLFFTAIQLCLISISFAQPQLPQHTITVQATQPLDFGAFCLSGGSSGTVTVGYDGSRTSTGAIALLPIAPYPQPAIFEIKLCQGRNVSVSFSSAPLLGNNGGSLSLALGSARVDGNNTPIEDGSSFEVSGDCNFVTILRVGGTITVDSSDPPGEYSTEISITFIQE